MGFPVSYVLPDSHKEAMFMLGNAVCPPVAADLLAAIWLGPAAPPLAAGAVGNRISYAYRSWLSL